MSFLAQTALQKLRDLQAYIRALRSELSVGLDTDEGIRLQSLAEALEGLDVAVADAILDVFVQTATTAALLLHAEARLGPSPRKGATISSGTDALRVYGTVGATVAAGGKLKHTDNSRYQLTEGGTIPGAGYVDVSLESITAGASVNKLIGDELSFESPPANITTVAELVGDLSGGKAQETDDELRVRVLDAYRNPPAGGRFSDYRQWATAITDVDSSYIYGPSSTDLDGRRGLGVVDVAILKEGSGAARLPAAALVQEVQDAIDDVRPSTTKGVLVYAPGTQAQDVDVQVTPATGYEWDWTGSGVVASYAAKVITWVAALPATLTAAVDAYIAGTGSAPRIYVAGQVLTVVSYNGGAKTTTISETPSPDPANPDPIYPGGPLSTPVQDAIEALFDALGPARGTAADPEQSWDDTLRLASIFDAIMEVTGVKDVVIATPGANVTPTDNPTPGVPDLLIPGTITARPV